MADGDWFDLGSYANSLIEWVFCGATRAICFVVRKINEHLTASITGLMDLLPDMPIEIEAPGWFKGALKSADYWFPMEEFVALTIALIGVYIAIAPWRWVRRIFFG